MFRNVYIHHRIWNIFILLAAFIYVLIMIKLLFLRGTGHLMNSYSYNVIPFKTIKQYIVYRELMDTEIWMKNLFGNIVLFIPLGVLGPLLSVRLLRPAFFLESIVSLLFCVEIIQLITKVGSFDIDDVILNTFGAMIGLLLTRLFGKGQNT